MKPEQIMQRLQIAMLRCDAIINGSSDVDAVNIATGLQSDLKAVADGVRALESRDVNGYLGAREEG